MEFHRLLAPDLPSNGTFKCAHVLAKARSRQCVTLMRQLVLNSTCNVLVACASNKAKTHVEMHSGQTAAVINEPISNLFYRI